MPVWLALASFIIGCYSALSAHELWRGRGEALASRRLLTLLEASHAGFYWLCIPIALLMPLPAGNETLDSAWLALTCFGANVFVVSTAFLMMAMAKERAECEQRRTAETDALTGLASRRAFVAAAERACTDRGRSLALLLLDLDDFKAINDTYGHEVGDGALVAFAHLARAMLPRGALLGRLGGEAFACLISTDAADALAVAERLRGSCAAIALPDYPGLAIRVSIGLSTKGTGERARFAALWAPPTLLSTRPSGGRDRVVLAGEMGSVRDAIPKRAAPGRVALPRTA